MFDKTYRRKHKIGVDDNGKAIWANTAPIVQRSLACVGGVRQGRNYSRKKGRKWGSMGRTITPMMLFAVAQEIARRRAKNKMAAQSRRINRGR